ncbi:hypothetical protein INT48_002048 [Thamnidium elegans]|uniref:IPT/TIG domain-containing protein n=1 Tax=Thamnidium elegans TaxID=101142 RepID=A0A8H7W3A0_9FUNG|nr:hypothetical protein INT48_002048 [Thamnidium elegans]
MPPFSPKTISESELQDLLLADDSIDVHDNYLPLFQDLPAGFELLYNSPYSPTLDSPSTDTTFCSPTSQFDDMKQEIDNEISKPELANHVQIRILGVPNTGAKSRVETQIKLCIQLMTGTDKKVMDWSYIRIGENMLARSRLRKNQQLKSLDGSITTIVSDESKILQLEAKVVCASNTDHPIRIISFVMKNNKGDTIATGISPSIMITDDHKSSKQKSNRKRSRELDESFISRPNTPAASRRNSVSTDEDSLPLDLVETLPLKEEPKEIIATTNEIPINDNLLLLYDTDVFNNTDEVWPFNRRRRTTLGYTSSDMLDLIPQLDRLVPAQGPTYGGIEVTLLGSGFYRGLTCLFGEHQATTAYWNSSTMVCLLPPATQTGAVVVSFKEHPIVLDGQDVALFTYYDASDQALLELALQVVGLKSTGILQDAKSVAMGIVQGDEQYATQQQNIQQQQQQQQQQYRHIQQSLVDALEEFNATLDLTLTNANNHSLLHLAVIANNEELVKLILSSCLPEFKTKLLNLQDKNEMTALHFACLYKSTDMVRTLLHVGCNPTIETKIKLDIDSAVQDLLDLYTNNHIKRKPLSRRPSVKSHMMHRFHSLSSNDNEKEEESSDLKTPSMESDGLGFVRQKIDRRLYLFWLPLLIRMLKKMLF